MNKLILLTAITIVLLGLLSTPEPIDECHPTITPITPTITPTPGTTDTTITNLEASNPPGIIVAVIFALVLFIAGLIGSMWRKR